MQSTVNLEVQCPSPLQRQLSGKLFPITNCCDALAGALTAKSGWRAARLERVKRRFTSKQFQVFDLFVRKEWPAKEVARALGISLANVYFTRHRLAAAIAKEIKLLEQQLERAVAARACSKSPPN
jgi:DNA-directed RNA polymerase specialized sigma24 family protein